MRDIKLCVVISFPQSRSRSQSCMTIGVRSVGDNEKLTLTLQGPSAGVSGSLDSYCSLKPLWSGMGEVVPARTSPTLLPHPLALRCHYPVSKCPSASIAVTGTVRVNVKSLSGCGLMLMCLLK